MKDFSKLPPSQRPRRAITFRRSPGKGKIFTSLVVNARGATGQGHKQSIQNAREAGARAIKLGTRLQALVKKHASQIMGALPKGRLSKLQARRAAGAFLSSALLSRVAKNAVQAGQRALNSADKHEARMNARNAAARNPKVAINGDVLGMLSGVTSIVLDPVPLVLGDDATVSAPTPTDGSTVPDSAYLGGNDPTNPYGLGPAPTLDSVRQQAQSQSIPGPDPSTDANAYSNADQIPGAIICHWERGVRDEAVGSFTRFYKPDGVAGVSRGWREGFDLRTTQWGGGGITHDPGWMVYRNGGVQMDTVEDGEAHTSKGPYVPQVANASLNQGFGPLVGNGYPETVGLRYDMANDQWFWFRNQAPAWATAAEDQDLLNKAFLDYQAAIAAAAADAAAAAAQDKLNQAQADQLSKQQALEDQQLSHDQSTQQSQLELEAQKFSQQYSEQAAQLDLDRQRAALEQGDTGDGGDAFDQADYADDGSDTGDDGVDWGASIDDESELSE